MPELQNFSFWVGFIVASVFWWIIYFARPIFAQLMESLRKQQEEARLRADSNFEDTYRKLIYKRTQEMHLASSLFALDEIVETPKLLAPPVQVEPGMAVYHDALVNQSIPYMPDWPEVAATYKAPTLSIPEAMSGGMNVAITGQPGSGRSVALAHLASQIVTQQPGTGILQDTVPFLLHVADLGLPIPEPKKPEDLLRPFSEHVSDFAPVFALPRVGNFVQLAFQSGRALILLDGVDELPQAEVQNVSSFLRLVMRAYPQTRVILTAAPEYVDGLTALGFIPLALMPWDHEQQKAFLAKWTSLWKKYVALETWAQTATAPVDPILIERWLGADNLGLNPLEYTLKIWGAYAGDVRGARPVDFIESHIRRMVPQQTPIEALEVIGMQSMVNAQSIFDGRTAKEWVKAFEPAPLPESAAAAPAEAQPEATEAAAGADESAQKNAKDSKKSAKKADAKAAQPSTSGLVGQLVQTGLLREHPGSRMRFSHPIFGSLLAGRGLKSYNAPEAVLKQPAWSGQTQTMRFIAALGDATPIARHLLEQTDYLLHRPKLTAARLLKDAPRSAPWRGMVMGALVELIQDEEIPLGLRGQIAAAFALSGDPGAGPLFRQLAASNSSELRQIASLGAGLLRDVKSVEILTAVAHNTNGPARSAACLALVEIGTAPALEAVAVGLLRGDEELRIAAAEALANHPGEGHDALREGVTAQDILLRRAVVYGLARTNEQWAFDLLAKVQVDDDQWVVRNAAVELLANLQKPNPRIPKRLTAPSETSWVLEFAAKYGIGVVPGQPATDLFLLAIKEKEADLRMAALNYLRYSPNEGVISALYQIYYGTDAEAREAVYEILSFMALTGLAMPNPKQFGLG
jgi:HEAT repeat protein